MRAPTRQIRVLLAYYSVNLGIFILCVAGFIAGNVGSSILFKYAADAKGSAALWRFVIGNLIGFIAPIALTFALKRSNPNLTYALCYGGAFAALQLASWKLFNQPLSVIQWAGVGLVGVGILLLQVKT
jgi:multidrug transporter EmrE-like cation transporter